MPGPYRPIHGATPIAEFVSPTDETSLTLLQPLARFSRTEKRLTEEADLRSDDPYSESAGVSVAAVTTANATRMSFAGTGRSESSGDPFGIGLSATYGLLLRQPYAGPLLEDSPWTAGRTTGRPATRPKPFVAKKAPTISKGRGSLSSLMRASPEGRLDAGRRQARFGDSVR